MCGIRGHFGTSNQQHTEKLYASFSHIHPRGPDSSYYDLYDGFVLGFHRLAIMDVTDHGMQPFTLDTNTHTIHRMCNGEIYNHQALIEKYRLQGALTSHSDCEVIGHIFAQSGIEQLCAELDGEFALSIITVDKVSGEKILYLARDPFGVRPLFRGTSSDGFYRASEAKGLVDLCDKVEVFEPGTYSVIVGGQITSHRFYHYNYTPTTNPLPQIQESIYNSCLTAVAKRLTSDRPLGCLLSGGLDSSLICGLAQKLSPHQLQTFTIGLEGGTDIHYAEMVAKYIGSNHTTFVITIDEALQTIDTVIKTIESRDTTTIRASVRQYLIGKYISEKTNVKVILTGEGSDELTGGYMYFHKAPSPQALHEECIRLLQDIHRFDGLRVDRAMAGNGLEVRIPLLDPHLVDTYLSVPAELRTPSLNNNIEKRLLRSSFAGKDIIPDEVLRRKKEAFSDGVSQQTKSRFEIIQEHIDTLITDEEFESQKNIFTHCPPDTKEKYYYRKKFREYFGDNADHLIPYYRMPKRVGNQKDPSARVLEVYQK